MLDVPAELLRYLTRLLAAERRRRGTPARSRKLTCRDQALLALRWFRDRTRLGRLAVDHGISRATAYRYVAEAVDVLSAQAPGLDEALERALADGVPYVILDGKIFETDRLAETVTSAKGEDIDAWYSGKKHRPGANVQAVMLPGGLPIWTVPAEPGHVHDITAARATPCPPCTAPPPPECPPWPTAATRAPESASTSPSRTRAETRARPRHENPKQPAARPPQPGRTRIRPAHPALDHPPAHHRQPQKNHRDSPGRPRPHPIRAQIPQLKIVEITSLGGWFRYAHSTAIVGPESGGLHPSMNGSNCRPWP